MERPGGWLGQYGMAILLALLFGSVLSHTPLFKQTPLPNSGVMASDVARVIGYGAALVMMWLLGNRVSREIPRDGAELAFLSAILRPMVTVMVLLFGYKVLSEGVFAFGKEGALLFNSCYAVGIIGAASWLTMAWGRNMGALIKAFEGRQTMKPGEPTMRLPRCERTWPGTGEFNKGSDGTVVSPTEDLGPSLGRYKIIKELGRGSMGVVYLGKDPTFNRSVAIKTMRLDQVDDPDELKEFRTRFFREAESTGRLSHPNIVTVYDAGEQDDLGYIAMELLDGIVLKQFCRKEALLPVKRVIEIVTAVAEALDYAHSQGVVHRDIKPANIMLGKNNTIKIMDFGIARLTTSTKTHTTMVLGTPSYMSPEQLNGVKVDGRSDIFSLGVVLFELWTGQKPFEAESISSLLFKIAHGPYRAPMPIGRDLPACYEEILNKALQKDPANRYQTAGELAQDLRTCLQGLAT